MPAFSRSLVLIAGAAVLLGSVEFAAAQEAVAEAGGGGSAPSPPPSPPPATSHTHGDEHERGQTHTFNGAEVFWQSDLHPCPEICGMNAFTQIRSVVCYSASTNNLTSDDNCDPALRLADSRNCPGTDPCQCVGCYAGRYHATSDEGGDLRAVGFSGSSCTAETNCARQGSCGGNGKHRPEFAYTAPVFALCASLAGPLYGKELRKCADPTATFWKIQSWLKRWWKVAGGPGTTVEEEEQDEEDNANEEEDDDEQGEEEEELEDAEQSQVQ